MFRDILRRVRKIAKSDYSLSEVCPPALMEQLGSHWEEFNEICCLSIFRKSVEKLKISLISDKNKGYFT